MFYHFIKLILLAATIFVGFPICILLGVFVAVLLGNALIGYWTTVICAVSIVLFVIVEDVITIYQMVKMVWK
jgi:hypothetical protein